MKRILFTADLHLTTRPLDAYRWEVFRRLRQTVVRERCSAVVIAGDLTDEKDEHPAALVNRVVAEITRLSQAAEVHVLMGNHDYQNPADPFFGFLSKLGGWNVRFYDRPTRATVAGHPVYMLPHAARPKAAWAGLDVSGSAVVVAHQPVVGARAENGSTVRDGEGCPLKPFKRFAKTGAVVIAGDIHVPQRVGPLTYCGAPHPVRFGDDFTPRFLVWDGTASPSLRSVPVPCLRKAVLVTRSTEDFARDVAKLGDGDMVKVTVTLPRSDFYRWRDVRREIASLCQGRGVVLCGVELKRLDADGPAERDGVAGRIGSEADAESVFRSFCKKRKIPAEYVPAGLDLLGLGKGGGR